MTTVEDRRQKTKNRKSGDQGAGYQVKEQKAEDREQII
jgi:hypothetical protein